VTGPDRERDAAGRLAGGRIRDAALEALRAGRFAETERLLNADNLGLADLTHELVVHQAELEMQAEELREAGRRETLAREHAEQLFAALPFPALTIDPASGEILEANAAADGAFRVVGPSIGARALFRRLGADAAQQDALAGAVARAASRGRVELTEAALRQRDDAVMLARVRLERITGRDGAAPCLLAVIVDETAQRRILARLDASETRFREIAASVSDVFFVTDGPSPAHTLYVSDGAAALWGCEPEAGLPADFNPFETAVLDVDRPSVAAALAAADRNEVAAAYRIIGADGALRWISSRVRRAPDGQRLIGTLRDITDARRDRLKLEALERRARCLATILELANAPKTRDDDLIPAIVAAVVSGMPAEWHPAVRIRLDDREYRSDGWWAPADPLRATLHIRGRDVGWIEAGHAAQTCPRPCSPGSLRCACLQSAAADAAEHGETFDQIARQITRILENRALADQLAEAERLGAIGKLTGGIAHDFNNLLTVIVGQAETLADDPQLGRARRDAAERILRAALRASDLTGYLLSYARRQPLAPEAIDIEALLAELHPVAARTLGEDIVIEIDVPSGTPAVEADASLLHNALLNLLLNARDAMPDGGRVTIRAQAGGVAGHDGDPPDRGDAVCIVIADTGIGMAPEILAKVEEPFFSTKPPGKGSGLGLSMVSGFVHQSGGRLKIDSAPNAGTCVTLCLPRAAARDTRESDGDG